MPTGKSIQSARRAALFLALAAALLCFPFSGIPQGPPAGGPEPMPMKKIQVGRAVLWVEVADTPERQARGLMFRESLPAMQGMLFIYRKPEILSFWMKNTFMPLDIAFISADGTILEIHSMSPSDGGRVYRSGRPALYALEVNRGWFITNGVSPGDKVRF